MNDAHAHGVAGARAPDDSGPRRSLVLAGGGMRVAYQAGVVQALFDYGLRFDHADGTSGGTFNLAMLMTGLQPHEMCERWRNLHVRDFAALLPVPEYLSGPSLPALGSAEGIVQRVFPQLGIDVAKINSAGGMVGTFNVCNFSTKTNEAITHDRVTLAHLVAGVSLPIFLPGVPIGGDVYTDSVWVKDANVLEAIRRGAEEIWIVWCIGNTPHYHDGPFPQYVHMIEMSANGKLFAELEWVCEINRQITLGERRFGQRTPIRVHVVKPDFPLPLDPDYFLGRIDSASLIAMGYADAHAYCATLGTEAGFVGVPLTPAATQMKSGLPGISFRQTLTGSIDIEGAEAGARSALGFQLRAFVLIPDLKRFLLVPEHAGVLNATLDIEGFGTGMVSFRGEFRVGGVTGRSALNYAAPFVHAGMNYFLEASSVESGSALALAELHVCVRRDGRAGPVFGKGTLRLSGPELLASMSSVCAVHCESEFVSAEVIASFGTFFFRELFAPKQEPWWRFWKRGHTRRLQ